MPLYMLQRVGGTGQGVGHHSSARRVGEFRQCPSFERSSSGAPGPSFSAGPPSGRPMPADVLFSMRSPSLRASIVCSAAGHVKSTQDFMHVLYSPDDTSNCLLIQVGIRTL